LKRLPKLGVMPHPIAVAADVDDVTVMEDPVNQSRGHDFVAEDVAPLLEALVRSEHSRGVFVTAAHELEEEHGAGAVDREIAYLVHDEQRGVREHLEPLSIAA